jgi:DnaJ-class molecular chaperone
VEIVIPAGIHDGKKLRVPGRGSLGSGGRAGDLYVTVKEIKDPHFTRRGDELETEVEVPFAKAILGGEIQVRTLRGSVTMRIPECTQQGQTFRLAEQGISQMKGKRGNLLVRIKITTPKQINSKMRSALQQFAEAEVSL